MKFYMYNIENPDQIIAGTEKPRISEKGPYSYVEERRKIDISDESYSREYIQFGQYKAYSFDKDTSCDTCSKDDVFTVINGPLVGLLYVFDKTGFATYKRTIRRAIEEGKNGYGSKEEYNAAWLDSLFMEVTVDDLIFSGTIPGALQYVYDRKMDSLGTCKLKPSTKQVSLQLKLYELFSLFNVSVTSCHWKRIC